MNRFGEIADELTELIEELEQSDLAGDAGALRNALQRAFEKACEAERVARIRLEAEPRKQDRPARPQRRVGVSADPPSTAQVIQLPRSWRFGAGARRPAD